MSKRMMFLCVVGVMVFGGMTTASSYANENALRVQAEKSDADKAKEEAIARRSVGAEFEIKGKTVDGEDFNWKDYKGKVVLIDFWATWCGPCIREVPNMIEVYGKYKDKGFEIVGVGVWDETEKLKESQKSKNMTWVSIDENQTEKAGGPKLSAYYGVSGIPTMFIVGRDGKIAAVGTRGDSLKEFLKKEFGE